jgi:endoglucanase
MFLCTATFLPEALTMKKRRYRIDSPWRQNSARRCCETFQHSGAVGSCSCNTNRKVDRESQTIESTLRYEDYDFDSRVVVTAKGKGVEISVYLDKPVPTALEGSAGFNLEFLPSQYWGKTYLMDGRYNRFPRYVVGNTITRPNSEKPKQFKGYVTSDDRGTGKFIDPLPLETGRTFLLAPDEPERW